MAANMKDALDAIARELGIDTLEDRGYHEAVQVSKARLRRALEAAYRAGERAGARPHRFCEGDRR